MQQILFRLSVFVMQYEKKRLYLQVCYTHQSVFFKHFFTSSSNIKQNLHTLHVVLEIVSFFTCCFSILSTENSCAVRVNIGFQSVFTHKPNLFVSHLVHCSFKEFSHEG